MTGILKKVFEMFETDAPSAPAKVPSSFSPQKAAPISITPRVANEKKERFEQLKDWLRQNEVWL